MFGNALALALLTTGGLVIVYRKLPRNIRKYIEKYSLFADMLALIGVYLLMGQTLTALMAGALAGIFTSILLHVANNEDDFLFLFDARDWVKKQLEVAKRTLDSYGIDYRQAKEEGAEVSHD